MVYYSLLDRYFGQSVRSPAPQAKGLRFLTFPEMQWLETVAYGGGGGFGVFKPTPPPKFRRPSKIVPNSTRFVKTVKNL